MEVNVKDTFGAAFVGGMVAAIVYGITTLQTYLYYVYYPRDNKSTKFLVASIWVLDTTHLSFMCHALYHYLVSSFGDDSDHALTITFWSLIGSLGLNLCMAIVVQTYFTFQISYLTRSSIRWWLTCAIMVVVFAHFAFGLEAVVLMFGEKEFAAIQRVSFTRYRAVPFAITTILSDICITVALCVLLHGNRSPIIETNVLVNTLIVYAINRCLLTSIMSMAEIIVATTNPNSLWFMALDFVIGKLYANSFLASLNSRNSLRERGLYSRNESTSFRLNAAVNLSGLGSSTEGDSSASAQNWESNVSGSAHVKTIPDDLEMDNLGRGDV